MARLFDLFRNKKSIYGKVIFTFPDGRKLYQVKDEYIERLPNKKLLYIQENANYIAHLDISKATLTAGHRMITRCAGEINALAYQKNASEKIRDKTEELIILVNQIDTTRKEYDNTNEAIMLSLFDLFFFFDNENPFEWSDETMERKRYYLNQYPSFRRFFFQKLNEYTVLYKSTFQNCINFALMQSTVQELVKDLSHIDINEAKTS